VLEDKTAEVDMQPAALERAFQLLARWAVRRARENRKVTQGPPNNGVTGYVSKG
jgi:hypothetical protein